MKKSLALILALVLLVGLMAGCSGNKNGAVTAPSEPPASEKPAPPAEGGALKTGLGVITGIASSKDVGEKDGLAQTDSTIAAVLLDEKGVITDCKIDGVQAKIAFGADGKLITPMDTTFKTKNELGTEYDMKKASGIGKEWNEQAAAFAKYCIGKTAEELSGIAMTEGKPSDADLASSVTIHIGDFIAAVQKAAANAQALGAMSGDVLKLAASTEMSKSADAGEKDGVAQAYITMTAASYKADMITSCVIDAVQANVNFSKEGKITSDLKAEVKTKNELGDAYGMKKASGIGKEWNEQAAAFAKYVTGKTVSQVKGIAISEGAPKDADLASSVTIGITEFQALLEKASK
ncbi:MAG: hypothetical protein RSF77_01285 [Oscillospiraceae bacterium]